MFDAENKSPNSLSEAITGWSFHYVIGIAYAAMYPLFWGVDFITSPTWLPFFLIGIVLISLAGLMALMPAMGGGIFARKTPEPWAHIIYVLIAHFIFAATEYLIAISIS